MNPRWPIPENVPPPPASVRCAGSSASSWPAAWQARGRGQLVLKLPPVDLAKTSSFSLSRRGHEEYLVTPATNLLEDVKPMSYFNIGPKSNTRYS